MTECVPCVLRHKTAKYLITICYNLRLFAIRGVEIVLIALNGMNVQITRPLHSLSVAGGSFFVSKEGGGLILYVNR